MTGLQDNDGDNRGGLHGPSERDIERFNREDAEYLARRKSEIRAALWKLLAGAVVILLVATMTLNILLPVFNRGREIIVGPERVAATVTHIFDGRTIGVNIDGVDQTVRYIGVDIPEFGDPFYEVGIAANRQWILGEEVMLEADEQDTDSDGNLLRYVWLDDAMINLNLVASGISKADTTGPNDRYSEIFSELEGTARANNLGIWEGTEERSASILPADLLSAHGQI